MWLPYLRVIAAAPRAAVGVTGAVMHSRQVGLSRGVGDFIAHFVDDAHRILVGGHVLRSSLFPAQGFFAARESSGQQAGAVRVLVVVVHVVGLSLWCGESVDTGRQFSGHVGTVAGYEADTASTSHLIEEGGLLGA